MTSDNGVRAALEAAVKALQPMAAMVFNDNGDMTVSSSVPTYDQIVAAYFAEKHGRHALSHHEGQPTPSDPVAVVTCDECQGNGEIVTDWDRYLHAYEGDVGDEAVAECPRCSGQGTIPFQPTPSDPVEPSAIGLPQPTSLPAEPIGYTNSDELADLANDQVGQFFPKADWYASIPLYPASALAAERARADELETEMIKVRSLSRFWCEVNKENAARADAAEATIASLRGEMEAKDEALRDCIDTLATVEREASVDPQYGDEVERLGRRIGFGALMSSAQASWRKYLAEANGHAGGEFVAGPCFATVIGTLRRARSALEGKSQDAPPPERYHPAVLAAHAEFGGDLQDMQRRYDAAPPPGDKDRAAATPTIADPDGESGR